MEIKDRQKYIPWLEFFYQVGAIVIYAIISTLIWIIATITTKGKVDWMILPICIGHGIWFVVVALSPAWTRKSIRRLFGDKNV